MNYKLSRLSINIKMTDMKTENSKMAIDNFNKFALSNEEMINIRGGECGEGEPVVIITKPPIII
jgi:hypothetical protein